MIWSLTIPVHGGDSQARCYYVDRDPAEDPEEVAATLLELLENHLSPDEWEALVQLVDERGRPTQWP